MLDVINKIDKWKSECRCSECKSHYITNHYDAKKSKLGHLCNDCKNIDINNLSQALLKKHYNYDPNTGKFTAKLPTHFHNVGDEIGSISVEGYLETSIKNKRFLVHRLIWLYMTGNLPEQVDHINHNRQDNRWINLREVNNTNNIKNCSLSKNSVTKINGVNLIKATNKYRAYITVNKKQIHLGIFDNINEAIAARKQANIDYGFHVNHGN